MDPPLVGHAAWAIAREIPTRGPRASCMQPRQWRPWKTAAAARPKPLAVPARTRSTTARRPAGQRNLSRHARTAIHLRRRRISSPVAGRPAGYVVARGAGHGRQHGGAATDHGSRPGLTPTSTCQGIGARREPPVHAWTRHVKHGSEQQGLSLEFSPIGRCRKETLVSCRIHMELWRPLRPITGQPARSSQHARLTPSALHGGNATAPSG